MTTTNGDSGLHRETFRYQVPTDEQRMRMQKLAEAFTTFAGSILPMIPAGPDRTYLTRQLRDCAMWANQAVMRQPDGSPRS